MSAKPTAAEKHGITLLRMGVGKQEFDLPEGSTLADLLRAAGLDAGVSTIFIDGKSLEESVVLPPGTIVSVGPKARGATPQGGWGEILGAFQNDPAFDAMMERLNADREAEKEGL